MNSESKLSQTANSSFSMDDFAKALEKHDYQFQKGQVVRGKIFQVDHDGAYVDIGGKSSAFLPQEEASLRAVTDLSEILPMDEELEFLIIRDQDAEGQVTISRKQLEMRQIWEKLAEIQENSQTVQVRVTGVNKGGVTVDLFGLRGFIPRSHLVEKNDLDSLMGQLLTANILEANQETNKLVLSQRKVMQAQAMTTIAKGTLCAGRIVKLQPYGVFVDLNGVTGLLHITQVSGTRIEALDKVFQYGQEVQVVVLDIDEFKNRISLSTKILEAYPGELLENFEAVMDNASERFEQAQAKLAEMA
jgi:small subunit ribosomal protein S1